jgi:hypothetical protein
LAAQLSTASFDGITHEPLPFKGGDFAFTDITCAIAQSGLVHAGVRHTFCRIHDPVASRSRGRRADRSRATSERERDQP